MCDRARGVHDSCHLKTQCCQNILLVTNCLENSSVPLLYSVHGFQAYMRQCSLLYATFITVQAHQTTNCNNVHHYNVYESNTFHVVLCILVFK